MAELKVNFIRQVLICAHGDNLEATALRLRDGLPDRLKERVTSDLLRNPDPMLRISLDDGEDVLLSVDRVFGDGSGSLLERAGADMSRRLLLQDGGLVIAGDLPATVARMRIWLQNPFVDVDATFDLQPTTYGLSLGLGINGRSRSAKILWHVGTGMLRTAYRFAMETDESSLRIKGNVLGDRALLTARYRASVPPPEPYAPLDEWMRRSPATVRAVRHTSLSDEVERILGNRVPFAHAPHRVSSGSLPAAKPESGPPVRRAPSGSTSAKPDATVASEKPEPAAADSEEPA